MIRHDLPAELEDAAGSCAGLRGVREFRAVETAAPDNERGVAVEFAERSASATRFSRELETYFAAQRFSNNAAAFEAVKSLRPRAQRAQKR